MKVQAQKEMEASINATDKPELNNTNTSWVRAKAEHDGIAEAQRAKEKALEEQRNIKERELRQKEIDEAERLENRILKKNKQLRKKISKQHQSHNIDRLARTNVHHSNISHGLDVK